MTAIHFNRAYQSKLKTRKIIMPRFVISIVAAIAISGAVAAFGPTRNPEGEMIVSIDQANDQPVDPAHPTFQQSGGRDRVADAPPRPVDRDPSLRCRQVYAGNDGAVACR
jgi:hypothetical protein